MTKPSILKQHNQISTVVIDITPGKALEFIKNNTRNRPISDPTVKKYANFMRKGQWQFNGEPIIVAQDGTLVDGQHRLEAILASGTTQKTVVVYGVSADSFHTVDCGKKRNGADALSAHNKDWAKNRTVLSAAVGVIRSFDRHGIWHGQTEKMNRVVHQELIEYVEANPDLHHYTAKASSMKNARKIVPTSVLAALYFLFSKVDQEQAEEFFTKLETGENLERHDPILLLRDKLINVRSLGGVFRADEIVPYVVKAWELMRMGSTATRLVIRANSVTQII